MELAGLEPATSWVRFKSAPAANPLPERLSGHCRARKSLRYPTLIRGFWGWNALHPQNDRAVAALPHPCALREHALGQPPLSDLVQSARVRLGSGRARIRAEEGARPVTHSRRQQDSLP